VENVVLKSLSAFVPACGHEFLVSLGYQVVLNLAQC
jgi:hypothetical protein